MDSRYVDPQMSAAHAVVGKHDAAPGVRFVDHGAVELVWVRRGRLHRCRIERDGTVHGLFVERRPRRWMLARLALVASLLAFVCTAFVVPWIFGGSNPWLLVAVGGVVVLTWIAGGLDAHETRRPLRHLPREAGWAPLRSFNRKQGSAPLTWLTLAGLLAVEKLATQRGDLALTHRRGDGSVEVVSQANGRIECHEVAADGELMLTDSTETRRGFGRGLGGTLESRARRLYGGPKSDWDAVDFRPTD